jgi:hypothetical protein
MLNFGHVYLFDFLLDACLKAPVHLHALTYSNQNRGIMIRHALLWLFHLFLNFYRFVSCLRPRRAPQPLRASRRKLPKHLAVVFGDYYGDRTRSQMTSRATELEDTIGERSSTCRVV